MVIAEHVTGLPMPALHRRLLFEPLGLADTWWPGEVRREPVRDPATVWVGDRALIDRPLAMRSFGDLYSTIDDVIRFGLRLFSGDVAGGLTVRPLRGDRVLIEAPLHELASLCVVEHWPIEYGLGMMRFKPSRSG